MSHDSEEWCKSWKKADLFFQKWQEFGKFWPEHSKASRICILVGSYSAKYSIFGLKKVQKSFFHETEKWCQIIRKTGLWFGKWHDEFSIFSQGHSNVSKLRLLRDPSAQRRKLIEVLCVIRMKNDTKIEEKLTYHFKNDIWNLMNFDLSTQKSQIFLL